MSTDQDSPDTVERAREVFARQQARRWEVSTRNAAERVARLKRLRAAILARRVELCEAVRADFGRHPAETDLLEVQATVAEISHMIAHLKSWMRPQRVPTPLPLLGSRGYVRHEAKGLVLILSPWNYPFNLAVVPLATAVAAGNCVILRPSDKVRRTSRFLRGLIAEVFPEDEVAVLSGDRGVADALLELPFDHIFFTGSPPVGRKVMAAAAAHLGGVTLELGGKSPVIIDESARLDLAAERVAWGKFINAGQTCVAPDYVLVPEALAAPFVAGVKAAIARFYGASPEARAASADLACIVDQRSCERIAAALAASVAAGARVEIGGEVDVARRRIAPTVVSGVPRDAALMSEEIFGPVLPVLAYRDLDEAIAFVRGRPKPLALYVFGERRERVERVLSGTTAGGSCVNATVLHVGHCHLPFGGVGESGLGFYHGRLGFEALSHKRAVLVQSRLSFVRYLFPPYTARTERLLGWVRRLVS